MTPDCWCLSRGLPTCEGATVPTLLTLPDVRQRHPHDCGAAAYACVVGYLLGKRQRIGADPHDGVHPFELEPALRRAGLATVSGSMTLADLAHHQRRGRPVCCLIRTDDGGHWVVSRGVTATRVHFHDPACGFRWLSHADWLTAWHDQDRHGTVFRAHGVAAWMEVPA